MSSKITIREANLADAAGIARVHVDTWRSAYAGIVPASYLAALSYEQKAKKHSEWLQRPVTGSKTFVADVGAAGGIVAFAEGGPERANNPVYKGELFGYTCQTNTRGAASGSNSFGRSSSICAPLDW
jgi:hypothetical protein